MSAHRPFGLSMMLAAAVLALAPLAHAEPAAPEPTGRHAALTDYVQAEPRPEIATEPAAADPAPSQQPLPSSGAAPTAQKGITGRAIEKVKEVAKSAGDIFSRVPCLPPKAASKSMGSLPHVASRLVAGEPVTIVAFGSSSTQGYGSTAPEFTYPNRLAAQLRRKYPTADITIVNAGKGGEDAPEMMKRLKTAVIDLRPDLVIWQVGTNAVLRNLDPEDTMKLVEEGIGKIQAAGSDVVLIDPQYSPRVNEHAESAGKMMKLLNKVADLRKVGVFPRFAVMKDWHEGQSIPIDNFVISDGLHMSDWGYACFAQLLGDDIIKSVGQIKLGNQVPADVKTYKPM